VGNVGVELTYRRKLPGWKWTADGLLKNDAEGKQGWTNALPRASVTGKLFIDGQTIPVKGEGYHDHNWGDVEMSHSFAGWGWGRNVRSEIYLRVRLVHAVQKRMIHLYPHYT